MRITCALILFALTCGVVAAQDKKVELKTTKDKVSYGIGMNIGRQFKQQGMNLDPKMVAAGIATILNDQEELISPDDLRKAFEAYQDEQAKEKTAQAKANKATAAKFLAANAKKKGVKSTKSGLQYLVLKAGTGKRPTADDTVLAHYKGTFINGEMFDGTFEGDVPEADDTPIDFPLRGVIGGWTEGVPLMKVGARYRFFIPPQLAYKEPGRGSIPPNSLLIFDIQLMDIVTDK